MERCENPLKKYTIRNEYIQIIRSSSKGAQTKYFKDGYWYKTNYAGYEGLAEYVATLFLNHSNLDNYVSYEPCIINGKNGCRSATFLGENEEFLTIHRLIEAGYGIDVGNSILSISSVKERINFVLDKVYSITKIDLTEFLKNILAFDMLISNTDRHFNNFGIIKTEFGYREAPIFDNGAGFFSNWSLFPLDMSLEECSETAIARPFSGSFSHQIMCLGIDLKIDYENLEKTLNTLPPSRCIDAAFYQLHKYKTLFPNYTPQKQMGTFEEER